MCTDDLQRFINSWMQDFCGMQKMAFLLGYYSTDPNYPEGVRINVEALYEPPQTAQEKGFRIGKDNGEVYRDMIGSAL